MDEDGVSEEYKEIRSRAGGGNIYIKKKKIKCTWKNAGDLNNMRCERHSHVPT